MIEGDEAAGAKISWIVGSMTFRQLLAKADRRRGRDSASEKLKDDVVMSVWC